MSVKESFAIGARRHGRIRPLDHPRSFPYLIALCALLIFSVLAFGAVETWSTSILEICTALLFTVMLVHRTGFSGVQVRWNPLYPPMVGFATVAAIQLILNLTAYRYETLLVCLQYCAYGMLLFATAQIAGGERSAKLLVLTLGVFGSAVALFAISQNLSSTLRIYWLRMPSTDASIFGPYVNHDHYAGLMELLTPLALVLSLSTLVRGGQRILAAFAAVLMAGSIVLSLSRGGAISLVAELSLLCWMVCRDQKGTPALTRMLLLVLAVLAFLALTGSPVMWHHLGHLQDALRVDILRDSLRMFARKPLFGWGLGTFQNVYPGFRSFYSHFFINAAHNDYMQVLVETGLVGFSCVVWFVVTLYRSGLRRCGRGEQNWEDVLRAATLIGCTGILVHSLSDFNLQIPANAALFYVFCALATGSPTTAETSTSGGIRVYNGEPLIESLL
jgi:O-antigen ligase